MIKKVFFFLFPLLFLLLSTSKISAFYNPSEVPNNKFGIHIIDENDLDSAASLVNSSGGDWGYVTFVIRQDERNTSRWQTVFDKARKLHLIPIVRIATKNENGSWDKLNIDEIPGWVSFFNSLNWVIENRYIVVGNEPNHSEEWGGEVNPKEYADFLDKFSISLKNTNNDYFILNAGFDASSTTGKNAMDEVSYLKGMLEEKPDLFDHIDGWASHSYPNPGFTGSENALGRGTVRTFEWEKTVLNSLGVNKDLPVFITETGWVHDQTGKVLGLKNDNDIGQKMARAFSNAWNKQEVVAVTPFVLNYKEKPFDTFSWTDENGNPFPFYNEIQALKKKKGEPVQITTGKYIASAFSPFTKIGDEYKGLIVLENTGQSIWERGEIKVDDDGLTNVHGYLVNAPVEPRQRALIAFFATTPNEPGNYNFTIFVQRGKNMLAEPVKGNITAFKLVNPLDALISLKDILWQALLTKLGFTK